MYTFLSYSAPDICRDIRIDCISFLSCKMEKVSRNPGALRISIELLKRHLVLLIFQN